MLKNFFKSRKNVVASSIAGASLLILMIGTFAGNRNMVRLVNKNFKEVVEPLQNLVFNFNKPMIPENMVGTWATENFMKFTPAIEGRYKWISRYELAFSPAKQFLPCQQYTAVFQTNLLKNADNKKLQLANKSISFHTPYLEISSMTASWTTTSDESPAVLLQLKFNYQVEPAEVAQKMEIAIGGKNTKYKILEGARTDVFNIEIKQKSLPKEMYEVMATIQPGVSVPGTTFKTTEKLIQKLMLDKPDKLIINGVTTSYGNGEGLAMVSTNQSVTKDALTDNIKIEPEIEFVVTPVNGGFTIKAAFDITTNYGLTIKKELVGKLGGKMNDDFEAGMYFGDVPPNISFSSAKGMFLTSKGLKNIGVNILNLEKVKLEISKIYANNLLPYVYNNRYNSYDYYEDEYTPSDNFTFREDYERIYSDKVVDKMVETKDLPKNGANCLLNLDIYDKKEYKGVFLVRVSSENDYYVNASKLVSVSDIGILARETDDEVLVMANSILDAQPIAGAEITLVSKNNQEIAKLKTDNAGLAHFKGMKEKLNGFDLAMVTATYANDFNFMLLEDNRVDPARFETGGHRVNPSGMEAFIYGDRNLYRPGEVAHFNTVVRTKTWENKGKMPIKIKVLNPKGKEFQSYWLETNEQGSVALDVPLDGASLTGTYRCLVYSGNEVLLNDYVFSVEEFMPDRIKVNVSFDKTSYQRGETMIVTGEALNMFGPPAANRNYEIEMQLNKITFSPPKFKDYSFDIQSNVKFENITRTGKTGEDGKFSENYPIPSEYNGIGLLEASFYTSVFDDNGRPVNRIKKMNVFTQKEFFGMKLTDHYASMNQKLIVPMIALDQNYNPINTTAQVEIVKIDWQSVLERTQYEYHWRSMRKERIIYSSLTTFKNGKADLQYLPNLSGDYEIRVSSTNSRGYSVVNFYAYSWGSTDNQSFSVNTDGDIDITADKANYETGERVKLLFKTPFEGKLLVTIEKDKVFSHQFIETQNRTASFEFNTTDEHLPNVYVTATLIKKLNNDNIPLTVAHGVIPILVEKKSSRMDVSIEAPEQSRSSRKQTIKVKTNGGPGTQITIAVVDEGILQIKNYESPDPHKFFFQKRALQVGSFDLYPRLFPELAAGRPVNGGDGMDMDRRVNPMTNNRVKLVALWSGVINSTNGNGEYEIEIPKFFGDLRIMAVAYKDGMFGSATKNMKVFDPIVISSSTPRFLSPGDKFVMNLNLTNTTANNASVVASVKTEGPTSVVGTSNTTLEMPANREARTEFTVLASNSIGVSKITVTVKGMNETFVDVTEVTVRPASSLQFRTGGGILAAGQSKLISFKNDFIPELARGKLTISKSPLTPFIGKFKELLGYPHGCGEQTISKAFPQIYFEDIVKSIQSDKNPKISTGLNDNNPNYNVNAAINKLQSMQQYDGGLTYWPGGWNSEDWISVYGLHFISECEKKGFKVNAKFKSELVEYVKKISNNKKYDRRRNMSEDGTGNVVTYISRTEVYALYTLAVAGSPNRSGMNFCKNNLSKLRNDSRYLLAAAYMLAGDASSYRAILPKTFDNNIEINYWDDSYSSGIRNRAIVLNAMLESNPNEPQIATMSKELSDLLLQNQYVSTQEAAFSFLALGKLASRANKSNVFASITSNGKNIGTFNGTEWVSDKVFGEDITLKATGSGALYYFWENSGIDVKGNFETIDNSLSVRKEFYNRDGAPIDLNNVKQNDLVIVKVTLTSGIGERMEHIAITDLLPACFEIENPRLSESRTYEWMGSSSESEYFDFRDDRINIFTPADNNMQTYYYMVRAVSKGTFMMGPVSADAMNYPNFRSMSGGGKVTVN